jgi:hypothetical protein
MDEESLPDTRIRRENFMKTILFFVSKTGNFHKKQLKFLVYRV